MKEIQTAAKNVKTGDVIRFNGCKTAETVTDVFVFAPGDVVYLTLAPHVGSLDGDYKLRSNQSVFVQVA